MKEEIEKKIRQAVRELFPDLDPSNLSIKVEYPPDLKLGDYATPIALEGAKVFKQPPRETAKRLKDALLKNKEKNKEKNKSKDDLFIERVDLAGPGFLNIFLPGSFLNRKISEISREDRDFGRDILKDKGIGPILLEYVSANPTGPLNIVSARAASIGSCLYNLWEYTGVKVQSEYYVNDFGNQVDLLAQSVACRYLEKAGKSIRFPEHGYQGDYIYEVAEHCSSVKSKELAKKKLHSRDIDFLKELFKDAAVDFIVSQQKRDLIEFGLDFDNWFSEKKLHGDNKPLEAFSILEKSGFVFEKEGKKFFQSTHFGDDKDRVLIREDGSPAYFMADIAYHKDKLERGYKKLINIWGPDHHGYISRLKGSLQALNFSEDCLEVLIAQQVNLVKTAKKDGSYGQDFSNGYDKVIVKMSKRKGEFTTLRMLLQEIPLDVVRYFFVMRASDSPLDFDMDLAKSKTMENPVYYIQYAHARICSVLRENVKKNAVKPGEGKGDFWQEPSRRNLALWLLRFPDELKEIALNYEIHRLGSYLKEVAAFFQKFYQRKENRIIGGDASIAPGLLTLMIAAKRVINNGLSILGISAPESM